MKFKYGAVPLISGRWNKTYERFDRKLNKVPGYTGTVILDGIEYELGLVKQTDCWVVSVFGILGGKDMHFRTIAEAEAGAEQAFNDWVFWKGKENLHRLEAEYRRVYENQSR